MTWSAIAWMQTGTENKNNSSLELQAITNATVSICHDITDVHWMQSLKGYVTMCYWDEQFE